MKRSHRAGTLAATAVCRRSGPLARRACPRRPRLNLDAFLSALNRDNDIGFAGDNADLTAQLGERVCPMLVEPGKNVASVASTVADNGISPGMASFFTGIAISMYCPQMMGSIGNGTFLNMLGAVTQQPPACAGWPACPGSTGASPGRAPLAGNQPRRPLRAGPLS